MKENDKVIAEIQKNSNTKIRISISLFNDKKLVHAREWFMDGSSGIHKPSKNGLTFASAEAFTRFLRMLLAAEKKIVRSLEN